jgi:hypothetical protein
MLLKCFYYYFKIINLPLAASGTLGILLHTSGVCFRAGLLAQGVAGEGGGSRAWGELGWRGGGRWAGAEVCLERCPVLEEAGQADCVVEWVSGAQWVVGVWRRTRGAIVAEMLLAHKSIKF